jgi:predicted porin
LAALAAAGVASAQSSVTLFGIADVGYISKEHTNKNGTLNSKTTGVQEGLNAGNRIGFRGTEDLGGGLRAGFHIEQGINITNGALFSTRAAAAGQQYDGLAASGNMPGGAYSTGTNRQSFVSLGGGFGEVRIGFQYTALYQTSTLNGHFVGSEQPGGDLAHGTLDNANYGGTRANGITYISPRMSGVQATLQYGAGAGRETAEFGSANSANGRTVDNVKRYSLLLNYAQGPINGTFAHTRVNTDTSAVTAANVVTSTTTGGVTTGTVPACATATALGVCSASAIAAADAVDATAKLNQLGVSYQLGDLKLVASWAGGKRTNMQSTSTRKTDSTAYQFGAEYKAGAARPFVTIGNAKIETTTSAGVKSTTFDADLRQFGVRYDLSKRTVAYAMMGETKDTAASLAATSLAKRKFSGVGVAHSF